MGIFRDPLIAADGGNSTLHPPPINIGFTPEKPSGISWGGKSGHLGQGGILSRQVRGGPVTAVPH